MNKRYWLRGALIGFVTPMIASVIFVAVILILGMENGEFLENLGPVLVFLAWPAMVFATPIGGVLGWYYGKVRAPKSQFENVK